MRSKEPIFDVTVSSLRVRSWQRATASGVTTAIIALWASGEGVTQLVQPVKAARNDASRARLVEYGDEFNVEYQGARGRVIGAGRVVAVGHVGGDPHAELLARHHERHRFLPALDELAQGEGRGGAGIIRIDGAVEHVSVGRPAGVVHLDGVGEGGMLAAAAR